MEGSDMENIDIQCADLGRNLADLKELEEKTINALLAILEEQGPYAMFLYLKAREKELFSEFNKQCSDFLKKIFDESRFNKNGDILNIVKKLADDLDDLLFARDLLRQALIYARYHVKAK
jgi:hypothetical protein